MKFATCSPCTQYNATAGFLLFKTSRKIYFVVDIKFHIIYLQEKVYNYGITKFSSFEKDLK